LSEKMRVHILAKQLEVDSKVILEKCRAEGLTIRNHMSTLTAGQEATIREWFSAGAHESAVETSAPVDLKKVRAPAKRRSRSAQDVSSGGVAVAEAPPADLIEPVESPDVAPVGVDEPTALEVETPIEVTPPEQARPTVVEVEPPVAAPSPAIVTEPPAPPLPAVEPPPAPPIAPFERAVAAAPAAPALPVSPAGPQNVPAPAQLRGPRVVRYENPDYDVRPVPRPAARRPGAAPDSGGVRDAGPMAPGIGARRRGVGSVATDEDVRRAKVRLHPRRAVRGSDAGAKIKEWREQDLLEREERISDATGRKIHTRRAIEREAALQHAPAGGRKVQAEVHEPVRVREFCSAVGVPFSRVFPILKRDHNILALVTSTIPKDVAQFVALEFGVELKVVEARTALDELRSEFTSRERHNLQRRPPVVTMLGHVDHGKTSLLDAIRSSRVASGEDGGITQHIGASYVTDGDRAVTFLDTPGHKAFTAMRSRGAQLTDVVVLVVAVDDGLMPQTIEAISHAKAANVPIVIALNKIDLGEANVTKIYGQLAEHDLTPTEWGGHTDVIKTAATKRVGISELIGHLAEFTELLELKADPTVPATGTVIEAQVKEGVGPVVRALVQEGTLATGQMLACGTAHGKVRALLNDRGQRINEAGPAMPVEIWGLDDVPVAGDKFYQVDSLQRAAEVAEVARQKRAVDSRLQTQKARTLEDLFKRRETGEVPELNVIIKADVDGSVDVLKHALRELPTDEVRLTIRHAGIGPVNDSDVLLADASNAIIVAFRVVPMAGARKLADEKGVDIRQYRVIYEVTDEVKKALEGLLAPDERRETRATADVREVFRITKVGVVAGCYLTDGVAQRSHLARLIRDGVVVRDDCKIASLRRFKDDVKEVRAGMECGIRLDGFDDIKVGDTIELFEIVKVARTL